MRRTLLTMSLCISISSVIAGDLQYLGHTSMISYIRRSGEYFISADIKNTWNVWTWEQKTPLLHGKTIPNYDDGELTNTVDIQNKTIAVLQSNSFLIYHLPDTNAISVQSGPLRHIHVTSDGEYIWSSSSGSFELWDRFGTSKLSIPGNFYRPLVATADGRMFVSTGADSMLAYTLPSFKNAQAVRFSNGSALCWLVEGKSFLVAQSGVYRTYDVNGSVTGIHEIPETGWPMTIGFNGCGSYFWEWTYDVLNLYSLEAGNTPIATIPLTNPVHRVYKRQNAIGMFPDYNNVLITCTLGKKPVIRTRALPVSAWLSAVDCDSAGNWLVGNCDGLIVRGTANEQEKIEAINPGRIQCIHGTRNNKFAFSTAAGAIMAYDLSSGNPVPFFTVDHLATSIKVSTDGTKLFALHATSDFKTTFTEYQLPAGQVVHRWAFSETDTSIPADDFSISENGNLISQTLLNPANSSGLNNYSCILLYPDSNKQVHITNGNSSFLSPSGKYLAVDNVRLYLGNKLVNAVDGIFGGWFDDSSIVVNSYKWPTGTHGESATWKSAAAIKVSGDTVPGVKFTGDALWFTRISDSLALCGSNGIRSSSNFLKSNVKIINFRTGAVVWTPPAGDSAEIAFPVGSDYVVYQTPTALKWTNWRNPLPVKRPLRTNSGFRADRSNLAVTGNRITIELSLDRPESPQLFLYTLKGELFRRISLGRFASGKHRVELSLSDIFRDNYPAKGTCVAVLKTGDLVTGLKIIR